jgi:hypothetical protein
MTGLRTSLLILAVNLAACGGGASDGGGTASTASRVWPGPSYADVQSVFGSRCTSCHGSNGGLSLASPGSWANLVEVAAVASAGIRVVPHSSATSVLYRRITGDGLGLMPQSGGPLSAAQIGLIRAWIDEGGARQDLALSLRAMTPHVGDTVVLRLEGDSGELRTKVVLDPLPAADLDLVLPRVRETGSHSLAIWADENGNGTYDVPPTDHAWRISVPESGRVTFTHDTAFEDVGSAAASEPGLDFTFSATGMTPHVGQRFGLAVYEVKTAPDDWPLVGVYFLESVPAAEFTVTIPGIITANEDYRVDFFADLNGDGAYDPPPTDHAWRVFQSSTDAGLAVSFAHGTEFTDISLPPAP